AELAKHVIHRRYAIRLAVGKAGLDFLSHHRAIDEVIPGCRFRHLVDELVGFLLEYSWHDQCSMTGRMRTASRDNCARVRQPGRGPAHRLPLSVRGPAFPSNLPRPHQLAGLALPLPQHLARRLAGLQDLPRRADQRSDQFRVNAARVVVHISIDGGVDQATDRAWIGCRNRLDADHVVTPDPDAAALGRRARHGRQPKLWFGVMEFQELPNGTVVELLVGIRHALRQLRTGIELQHPDGRHQQLDLALGILRRTVIADHPARRHTRQRGAGIALHPGPCTTLGGSAFRPTLACLGHQYSTASLSSLRCDTPAESVLDLYTLASSSISA